MISKNRAVSALMATVVTVGVLAPLAATSASADPVAISKAGCTANRSKTKDGRTLTLYQCTEGLRGQATHASPGDLCVHEKRRQYRWWCACCIRLNDKPHDRVCLRAWVDGLHCGSQPPGK